MIRNEYTTGKSIKEAYKYNIEFDREQIINYTCANCIDAIIKQGDKYSLPTESKNMLISLVIRLLGHDYNIE